MTCFLSFGFCMAKFLDSLQTSDGTYIQLKLHRATNADGTCYIYIYIKIEYIYLYFHRQKYIHIYIYSYFSCFTFYHYRYRNLQSESSSCCQQTKTKKQKPENGKPENTLQIKQTNDNGKPKPWKKKLNMKNQKPDFNGKLVYKPDFNGKPILWLSKCRYIKAKHQLKIVFSRISQPNQNHGSCQGNGFCFPDAGFCIFIKRVVEI